MALGVSLGKHPVCAPTRLVQVDSHADFLHEDNEDTSNDTEKSQLHNATPGSETFASQTKPVTQKRPTSKSTPAPVNSLEMLDACLPEEPRGLVVAFPASATSPASCISPWLRQALFVGGDEASDAVGDGGVSTASTASLPLTARISPLAQRMRSLLLRGVYARKRRAVRANGRGGGWADGGRPAGFVGAGLAEELCLAVFGRIQGLRAQGVGKQVGLVSGELAAVCCSYLCFCCFDFGMRLSCCCCFGHHVVPYGSSVSRHPERFTSPSICLY